MECARSCGRTRSTNHPPEQHGPDVRSNTVAPQAIRRFTAFAGCCATFTSPLIPCAPLSGAGNTWACTRFSDQYTDKGPANLLGAS